MPPGLVSPEGDIGTLELSDIIDTQALQRLLDEFTLLTGMVTAILDLKGNVLVATGWQEICTRFHRKNPVTAQFCTESDLYLAENMKRGEYVAYKCKNNLWDVVTPLYIGDRHMGNIYTGQFFYDDEAVDESVFIAQAEKYGFDREEYLAALHKVPRISREKVTTLMDYLVRLTDLISQLSYSNLTLVRTMTERDALFTSLKKSEERVRLTLDATNDGIWDWNIPAGTAFFSPRWYSMIGYETNELPGTYDTWRSLLHPEDLGPAEQKIQDHIGRKDEGYAVEFRMRTKQGGWKWILARGKVIERDAGGNPVRMVGTHTDISEQKRVEEELERKHEELMVSYEQIAASEEELRQNIDDLARSEQTLRISEERLVMAQEIGHTGCWEYSIVTDTIWGSAEGLRMFGFPAVAKEVPIEDIESCIPERERVHQALVDLISKGKEYNLEYTLNPANGSSRRVVHSVAILDKDPQGNPVRVMGVIKDITERKQAEMALQESELKFRNLYQYAQVGLFETSLKDGTVVACNERYATLAGYSSAEDAIGKDIVHLYANPDDRKEVSRILHEQGHIDDHILKLKKHLTGDPFWVQFSARINREKDLAEGSIIDITERKLAELELVSAQHQLKEAHHLAHIGTWEWVIKTDTVTWSEELYHIAGIDPALPAPTYAEHPHLYTPASWGRLNSAVTRALETGEPYNLELEFVRPDGTIRWTNAFGGVKRDENQKITGLYGTMQDVTGRRQAEDALKKSEVLLQRVGAIARVGGWELDAKTLAVTWTEETFHIHEVTVGQVPPLDEAIHFFHPDERKILSDAIQRALTAGEGYDMEVRFITATGKQLWTRTVCQPEVVDGVTIRLIGIFQDITQRKRAELELLEAHRDLEKKVIERTRELSDANERLKELDRLKSMFIASMSHELRTPLNSIIGFTGIMIKGMAGEINPEQEKQLGMVQSSARHLLALINDVIDISKIEAGKIEAGVSTFDLADVLHEVQNTFGTAAAERGLKLNVEIPAPIAVTSDERRIRQIILNLVSNAVKFTDEGRIDVMVKQNEDIVEVTVRDTGIGISGEDLAQLFRPFVRVQVPGRLTEGTGLGLYLSKKIASFLGGDISGKSELHKGSVFVFSFPVVYEKQEEV